MFDSDESALVEEISRLERVKSAAAAGQASAAAALDERRRADEAAAGVPKARQGRGVASEVALARRDSPARGGRHLGFAKALVHEMPHTLAALECGALSEWRATLIVRESACLDVEDRRTLDAELCADVSKLDGMGDARVVAAAKEIACRLDVQAVVDRAAKAEADRTVTIRPAPDTMTYVTALLPVAKGVGVYAALKRAADTTFDDRSRGQVMADTLVERVTGQAERSRRTGGGQPGDRRRDAAWAATTARRVVEGYGPIPAAVARRLVDGAVTDDGRGRRCGGCTATRPPAPWWRWSRGRAAFRGVWPASSGCATKPVARRTVMRRSGIATTRNRTTATGRPVPRTVWVNANAATTPRNHPAGR